MTWCKSCGKQFQWMKSDNKKHIPLDPDGKDHRDTCKPDREYIAKRKKLLNI